MNLKSTLKKCLNKFGNIFLLSIVFCFLIGSAKAQTTITTNDPSYTGLLGLVGGNVAVTFVVENTNATSRTLTGIGMSWDLFFTTSGSATATLWYSATSLSGAPTIATPTWTQLATSSVTVTAGVIPTFTGLTFNLAPLTQYRFAVQSSNGIAYSPATATPNSFTGDGVVLKTNSFQIAGLNVGYAGAFPSPANNPRAFTGSITISGPAAPCTGTPAPGNTIASVAAVCPGIPVNLSLQNATAGSGVTYQWQQSATLAGPYTNVPTGGTNATYSTTIAANTYFRAQVTCSGNTGISTPVLVSLTPASGCYCIPPATNCTFSDVITNVTFAGINNTSTCSANGYANYTALTAGTPVRPALNPMSVTVGPGGTEYVGVWIDYNQNGTFDATEFTLLGSGNGTTITGSINIPATALLGPTRMRVRVRYNATLTGADACLGYTYGETEDYTVNIQPCVQGAFTTQPANASIACGSNASFTAATTGSIITYQWQVRTSATAPWTNVSNGGIYSGATTNTLTLTNVSAANTGYQYRAVINGACTATDFSNAATLTVTPLIATVNPASATICNGQIQQLSLTNILAPQAFSTTVSSGTISVPIPDNTQTGTTHTIPVTTTNIPTGAQLTGIAVRLNVPNHTWIGDMVFVLRAPNGQIINLDYYISNTGGRPIDQGFVNTVISSTGTALLSSTAAANTTYTGTYRADLVSNATAGPLGMLPTSTAWSSLLGSVPQGNWTLGMYDGGNLDVGTLTSWSIDFNYQSGAPATGVWAPQTGLFTDALATVPYTGTALNTVYAKPSVSTNYTVVVTTPTPCTSSVTTIPITVNNPVSAVSTVANAATCVGSNASFTVSASGGTINYQWQVSTDGGVTWTNLANGGNYAGVTTATLSVSNVTAAMNNNRYRAVLTVPSCNSLNSNGAVLTVNPNPTIVLSANPYQNLYPGITTTLTAAVSPAGTYTYTWFRNGVAVPGATGNTLIVNVDELGLYTVRANNSGTTCTNISNAISIGDSLNTNLFIYPSPNNGTFQVRYHSAAGNTMTRYVNIYDSKGARVYSKIVPINVPYTRIDVDIRNFGKGIYHVELADFNGARIKTGNVLVL